MSTEEQEAELARVRAFSRALFYNIRGDEDRCAHLCGQVGRSCAAAPVPATVLLFLCYVDVVL